MKTIIKVLLFVTLLIMIAGFGVGVYYAIDHFSIKTSFGEPTPIRFIDGSKTVSMQMVFTDKNIIREDMNENGTVVFGMDENGKLIEDYSVHSYSDYGFITTIASNGSVRVTVDPVVMIAAIKEKRAGM